MSCGFAENNFIFHQLNDGLFQPKRTSNCRGAKKLLTTGTKHVKWISYGQWGNRVFCLEGRLAAVPMVDLCSLVLEVSLLRRRFAVAFANHQADGHHTGLWPSNHPLLLFIFLFRKPNKNKSSWVQIVLLRTMHYLQFSPKMWFYTENSGIQRPNLRWMEEGKVRFPLKLKLWT